MIVPPTGVRVLDGDEACRLSQGHGWACRLRQEQESRPTRSRAIVYVFRAKRADKVKLLFWDGTGVCLVIKRLEGAKFRWPAIQDGVMRLSPAQLSALLEGLDWARVHMRRVRAPQATRMILVAG